MDFGSGPKLSRAMTFDERKVSSQRNSQPEFKQFTMLTKKSQTFVGNKSKKVVLTRERAPSFQFDDVLFRRHFGMKGDDEAKPFSVAMSNNIKLQGMEEEMPTFVPQSPANKAEILSDKAVVVVDTFTTGAMLANMVYMMGYKVICVLSADLKHLMEMVPEGMEVQYEDTIVYNCELDAVDALQEVVEKIQGVGLPVLAVFAGAETGVELADKISERMQLRTNGTALSSARRDKYVMGEAIRSAGLRAVKQLRATTWGEIVAWLQEWNPIPFKVIVKPMDSAGSDDVTLCCSMEEAQAAFGNIIGKVNGLGIVNKSVLVQEYLEGQEYVIDMVSRDGEHKVAAIWPYDRRAANGAGFVCFGQHMLLADDPHCRELIEYQKKVITALGIRNGPTHGEVKWCKGEPVLVEVGARCHGGEGMWVKLAQEALGYNQVQMTIDSYLHPDKFAAVPDLPLNRLAHVAIKWLVNYKDGIFTGADSARLAEVTASQCYRGHQIFLHPGAAAVKTQNCFSWGGCVRMADPSQEVMDSFYQRLEEMEQGGELLLVDAAVGAGAAGAGAAEAAAAAQRAVVVVDPFSTGAVLAADLCAAGVKVVALYSANLEHLDNLKSLVPAGLSLSFEAVVPFSESVSELVATLKALPGNLRFEAVLAGAETGVGLADMLSEVMGLRTNGTAISEARRNKYVMGEAIRSAGLRAVKQLRATTWSEVQPWLQEWNPTPFKVIVKPMESAGSDDVTLCNSMEEAEVVFKRIMGKINGLGMVNDEVLVQEYLEGQEYVIDIVSRDGEHKVAAIWAYDRRPINGAGFVCFGQHTLLSDEPQCRELIEYQKKVITALGIRNGPTHGEVKWCKGEPVLVEVGARCHGAEGVWQPIVQAEVGYNQVQMTIDAYLFPEKFKSHPYEEVNADLLAEIHAMPSFVAIELFKEAGSTLKKTVDCFTFGGTLQLIHESKEQVDADYQRMRQIEHEGLFICSTPSTTTGENST